MGNYYSFLEHESQAQELLFGFPEPQGNAYLLEDIPEVVLAASLSDETTVTFGEHVFQKLSEEDSDDTFVELTCDIEDSDDSGSQSELDCQLIEPQSMDRPPSSEIVLKVIRYYLSSRDLINPLTDTPSPEEVASVLNYHLMDQIDDLYRKVLAYQAFQKERLGDESSSEDLDDDDDDDE
jgi:hypothetical protein